LIWIGGAALTLTMAFGLREHANAPAPPPDTPTEQLPLAPTSPFSDKAIDLPSRRSTAAGTAFSVGDSGVWLTARHVLDGCRQSAIMVSGGQGVAARVIGSRDDVAVLTTVGGAAALPLAVASAPRPDERAFLPGFPHGAPGEVASRLLGPHTARERGRNEASQALLAWAEVGRTDGLSGALNGLSGAPVIDSAGEVVGVTLAEAPRRGRLYSSTPAAIRDALAAAGVRLPAPNPAPEAGEPMSVENYGRVADDLRRDLRVVQVVCLTA
jgi:S1-C subfamily serine protease